MANLSFPATNIICLTEAPQIHKDAWTVDEGRPQPFLCTAKVLSQLKTEKDVSLFHSFHYVWMVGLWVSEEAGWSRGNVTAVLQIPARLPAKKTQSSRGLRRTPNAEWQFSSNRMQASYFQNVCRTEKLLQKVLTDLHSHSFYQKLVSWTVLRGGALWSWFILFFLMCHKPIPYDLL